MTPTLVFDWNGTLLDDAKALLQTVNTILHRFNKEPMNLTAFREMCDLPFITLYRKLGLTEEEIAIIDKNGSAFFHECYEPLADKAELREGAAEILQVAYQQNITTLILSNHIVQPINIQLRRLGINGYIAEVLAYESRLSQYKDITKGERLRRYMAANQINPQSTIIIGDMPEESIIATNLGLISVAITGGFVSEARLRAMKPDYIIHSHHELPQILKAHDFY